jgi:Polysaccharide lyase
MSARRQKIQAVHSPSPLINGMSYMGTKARRVFFVATHALLCGCDRNSGPKVGAADAGDATGQTVRGPDIVRFDGFESDSVASFWRAGNAGDGRYAPGAVAVSADYARTGTKSVRIIVREGDIEQTGDDGKQTERAELDSGRHALIGRDVWYGFSFLIPPGFPVVDNRLVIAQWKQYGVSGSPLVAERFRNGTHDLTIRLTDSAWGRRKSYALPTIAFGRWNDMVYHIRFSRRDDGLVEVWMNGSRVVTFKGVTAFKEGEDDIYNKFGLYRDRWKDPMTIYFDNYTLDDGFAAVDPARFDRQPPASG